LWRRQICFLEEMGEGRYELSDVSKEVTLFVQPQREPPQFRVDNGKPEVAPEGLPSALRNLRCC
jgi:hypothetical protein